MIGTRITNKQEAIDAFTYGYFGNYVRVWDTLEEFMADDTEDNATIRCRDTRGGGGFCRYCVMKEDIEAEVEELLSQGYKPEDMYFNANPPKDGQILQFEYQHRCDTGWIIEPVMRYTYVNEPMRPALAKQTIHARGHHFCQELIRQHMTDASWVAFRKTVNRYPEHVLEVSCFNTNVGELPGHNSVIWEVRAY